MAAVVDVARELCEKDAKTEQECFGELLPCRKISPLEPFIKLEEYFMLERDTGKYLLYMSAIDKAIADITKPTQDNNDEMMLRCFVLGPGLGRLVRFCLDSARHVGVPVVVHVIEANPVAVEFLRKSFEQEIKNRLVILYDPFIFHPKVKLSDLPSELQEICGQFDLIVSELLGCYGDDEFLPELTSSLYKLLAKPDHKTVMIPVSWTNHLVPVSCPSTYSYLQQNNKPLNAGYTMGLPKDCVFLSETKPAWVGDCRKLEEEYKCEMDFDLDAEKFFQFNDAGCMEETSCCHSDHDCLSNENTHGNHKVQNINNCSKAKEFKVGKQSSYDNQSGLGNHSNPITPLLQDKDIKKRKLAETSIEKQEFNIIDSCHRDGQQITIDSNHGDNQSPSNYLHGFIGYFTSILYDNIMIDTRHTTKRNSFHWECYFVPVEKPICVDKKCTIYIAMERKTCFTDSNKIKLWYEWQAKVQQKEETPDEKMEIKKSKEVGMEYGNSTDKLELESTLCTVKQSPHECCDILSKNSKPINVKQIQSKNDSENYITCCNLKEDSGDIVTRWRRLHLQNKDGDDDAVYLSLNTKST